MGDQEFLLEVTEGMARSTMFASFRERDTNKEEWDPRTLDIRGVDIVKASLHEDMPYIIVTFVCQHVAAKRSTEKGKEGELKVAGTATLVENTFYSWAVRRDFESKHYDWKIFEFHYQHIGTIGV